MSQREKRKKGKFPRKRSEKALSRRVKMSKKYKSSGWKLKYPTYFMEIDEYPYIVRRNVQEKAQKISSDIHFSL